MSLHEAFCGTDASMLPSSQVDFLACREQGNHIRCSSKKDPGIPIRNQELALDLRYSEWVGSGPIIGQHPFTDIDYIPALLIVYRSMHVSCNPLERITYSECGVHAAF